VTPRGPSSGRSGPPSRSRAPRRGRPSRPGRATDRRLRLWCLGNSRCRPPSRRPRGAPRSPDSAWPERDWLSVLLGVAQAVIDPLGARQEAGLIKRCVAARDRGDAVAHYLSSGSWIKPFQQGAESLRPPPCSLPRWRWVRGSRATSVDVAARRSGPSVRRPGKRGALGPPLARWLWGVGPVCPVPPAQAAGPARVRVPTGTTDPWSIGPPKSGHEPTRSTSRQTTR
jgi:hypothetical protein